MSFIGTLNPLVPPTNQVSSMFSTFLIGIVLASIAALAALLILPRANEGTVPSALPWVGLVSAVLFAGLGFIGGFALGT